MVKREILLWQRVRIGLRMKLLLELKKPKKLHTPVISRLYLILRP